jgi:hypothetical protein
MKYLPTREAASPIGFFCLQPNLLRYRKRGKCAYLEQFTDIHLLTQLADS